jgi:hypothetical protein
MSRAVDRLRMTGEFENDFQLDVARLSEQSQINATKMESDAINIPCFD